MYDHRLAQVIHQETINNATAKRRQKAAGQKSESIGIRKLLGILTSIMGLSAMRNLLENNRPADDSVITSYKNA